MLKFCYNPTKNITTRLIDITSLRPNNRIPLKHNNPYKSLKNPKNWNRGQKQHCPGAEANATPHLWWSPKSAVYPLKPKNTRLHNSNKTIPVDSSNLLDFNISPVNLYTSTLNFSTTSTEPKQSKPPELQILKPNRKPHCSLIIQPHWAVPSIQLNWCILLVKNTPQLHLSIPLSAHPTDAVENLVCWF